MTRKRGGAPTQRQLRVGEALRHALAEILARGGLRDPALAEAHVTVTEVRISPDLRAATAFVLPFGGGDGMALARALNHAAGYFRKELAGMVELRVAPTIRFEPDHAFEQAERVDALLRSPAVSRDLGTDESAEPGDETTGGGAGGGKRDGA